MADDASPTPDQTLRRFEPPLAVEHLVFEVRADALDRWLALDHEHWTVAESQRWPGFVSKEVWCRERDGVAEVSVAIAWSSVDHWRSVDPAWLDAQEQRFAEALGPGVSRCVSPPQANDPHWRKVSEYR